MRRRSPWPRHPSLLFLFACASLALGVALPGCASPPAPLTELVLVVRADLSVPDLHITATGPDGSLAVDQRVVAPRFPLSVVMTRDAAPYGPVTIHVEGAAVAVDAITELVPGERRRLDVNLSASCLCVRCSAAQTCRAGACADRHVAATSLGTWISSSDASLPMQADAGRDAGTGDAGVCGCMGQPCCAGSCNGMLSCRMDVCRDCQSTDATITGTTPSGVVVTAVSADASTVWVSVNDGTAVSQLPFVLGTGVTATGTAPVPELLGMMASGSTLTVIGTGGSMGVLRFTGATLSGSFTSPTRPDGSPGSIIGITGSGSTLTLRAFDGSMGTITLTPEETCL